MVLFRTVVTLYKIVKHIHYCPGYHIYKCNVGKKDLDNSEMVAFCGANVDMEHKVIVVD